MQLQTYILTASIDTGSYYNRTPITLEKIVQSIYHSRVDGDSEVRFQLFEFIEENHRGTDITYTLDQIFHLK
ncbi:MAG: hypothetical protein AABZ74_14195 [Cyanobacteriota bacterium]